LGDLASVSEEVSDGLSEDGLKFGHRVFNVFLSFPGKDWLAPDALDSPDMILEPGRAEYYREGALILRSSGLQAMGDLNDDGFDEYGKAD